MATITVRGVELHYEESGKGRPVVFLHGVWMSGRFFERQLGPVGEQCRAISLDFRGHGQVGESESGTPFRSTPPTYARFSRQLDLDDVVLVGWSMGAFVIWEYVKQFGCDRLAGTVVVDEAASDFAWEGLGTRDDRSGDAARPERGRPERPVRADRPLHSAHVQGGADRPRMSPGSRAGDGAAAGRDRKLDPSRSDAQGLSRGARSVTVPTLVAIGGDEKLITREAGAYLVDRLPDARLVVFEDSSHCPFLEEAERFNAVVCEFAGSLG